jgi:hypothetical protein
MGVNRCERLHRGIMISFKSALVVLLLLAVHSGCVKKDDIDILKSGVEKWNKWREENPSVRPYLGRTNLGGANLDSANLGGANLDSANLVETALEGAKLIGASLNGANLESADLAKANLAGAALAEADLRGANLEGANFEGANLQGVNFEKTKFYGVNLERTDLRNAKLEGTDFSGAILVEADLRGVKLQGTDFSKVKSFYKAKLDPEILSHIKAKWPQELATSWDDEEERLELDPTLLEQIKKPDWHGWAEGKGQGK